MICILLAFPITIAQASSLRQGFVGTYHVSSGKVSDGRNTSLYDTFKFGLVAPENSKTDGGFTLEDDIDFHCDQKSINILYGMLLGFTEGGVLNQPSDSSLWSPAASPGILQGAHRWSELSKRCPQVAGVVIDDFWGNYVGGNASHGTCATCPSGTHGYGSLANGWYCCPWPLVNRHCEAPSTLEVAMNTGSSDKRGAEATASDEANCCLVPGKVNGCQGVKRCGNNPQNYTSCKLPGLNLQDMVDIKAALQGKALLPSGQVNHSSPATTPDLRLHVVWYTMQTASVANDGLFAKGIVDGVSLWIDGPSQNANHSNYTRYVNDCRAKLAEFGVPHVPIIGGSYVSHSQTGWLPPDPFKDMFRQSLSMYDAGTMQGFYVFSAPLLTSMNTSLWQQWNLTTLMSDEYQPFLGTAFVRVVDGSTGIGVQQALVVVTQYSGATHVTRKLTDASGGMFFEGWAGKGAPAPHMLHISHKNASQPVSVSLQLSRGGVVNVTIPLMIPHDTLID